jgi:hypothetical protein
VEINCNQTIFGRRMSFFNLHLVVAYFLASLAICLGASAGAAEPVKGNVDPEMVQVKSVTVNQKDDGYRGIWYMNQPSKDEFKYKYSGGLGTYCDYHQPMAVYSPEANKTFFCYGGTAPESNNKLRHMVSYFDHNTKTVPKPTYLLDKQTSDAHDNPVLSVDGDGYIWIFSSSHGLSRPSYMHRSKKPYDISGFEQMSPVRKDGVHETAIDNYSYPQFWFDKSKGFISFFTRYNYPAARTSCFMTSKDGVHWSEWQRLAAIGVGHYQTSAICKDKVGTVMNYHPKGKGLNWRTNLYYLESADHGKTWLAADGTKLDVPLTEVKNPALVHDYESKELLVYLKDLAYDRDSRPVILYETSPGYEPGPSNDPREIRISRWDGKNWQDHAITKADHNYDSACIYFEDDGVWKVIAASEPGPQPYSTGGEMAFWTSSDQGKSWHKSRQLTTGSPRNHTYARRPVDAHPDFYAIWADGNSLKPSESLLYFCDREGNVFQLPQTMKTETDKPKKVIANNEKLGSAR